MVAVVLDPALQSGPVQIWHLHAYQGKEAKWNGNYWATNDRAHIFMYVKCQHIGTGLGEGFWVHA